MNIIEWAALSFGVFDVLLIAGMILRERKRKHEARTADTAVARLD